jgi:Family of unknown function (DUF6167)
MFRRTFWFTAGAAAGVWATTKVNQKIRQLAPESLAAQAAGRAVEAGHRLKDFALDVRAGMATRETELGEALGIEAPQGNRALPASPRSIASREADRRSRGAAAPRRGSRHPYQTHNRNEDH